MAQAFLFLNQNLTWSISLNPNIVTVVAGDEACKPEDDTQPVTLTQVELNYLTQNLNL